jgi:hypothetical protein
MTAAGGHRRTQPACGTSTTELITRLDQSLAAAIRVMLQMPDDRPDTEVPNRPRSYRVLGRYIFRFPELSWWSWPGHR